MSEPTQKQKQLADEILRKFGNPDYTEEELTEEIPIVAQLLADAQVEEREVLKLIKIGLEVIIEDDFDFGEENAQINGAIVTAKDLLDKLNELLK